MKKAFISVLIFFSVFVYAQSDNLDSLFNDPSSTVIAAAPVINNPESAIFNANPFMWAGDFTTLVGVRGSYAGLPPSASDLKNPTERLLVNIAARLWFDARPDKNYRVFGKFVSNYPFYAKVQDAAGVTEFLNNIQVFELFSDFNWKEKVFFRFGKQTANWGLSRFYQIADPLTVGVKDPMNLTADLEGPLALKVAYPIGVNNLYFYSVVKDSYLPANVAAASVKDIGVGVKGDFLVTVPKNPVFGNGEVTLGTYYQRNSAPKAVGGVSTSIGDFQVFSDQALSWGLDAWRLTDTVLSGTGSSAVYDTEKPGTGLFYSATLGTMYVNNDWHCTLYGEYMFNSAASADPHYLEKWSNRYFAEVSNPVLPKTLVFSDIGGYLSMHNSGVSLSWSELPGNDKIALSALWLQNWIDQSGMLNPAVIFTPIDHFALETGLILAWGGDKSEWVLKNSDPVNFNPRRLSGYISFKIGGGKF
jgi:hypothetical protein